MTSSRDGNRDLSDEVAADFVSPRALYVHVPICASKCSYCDFFSVPASSLGEDFEDELVAAILDRAQVLSERFGAKAYETVYIGGGTPTLLSPKALDALLGGVSALAAGSSGLKPLEWTVEANPDSLGPQAIGIMRNRGVTRLSIGVQSLDPDELSLLGRRHGPDAALRSLGLAVDAGMAVSVDLIAGIPAPNGDTRRSDSADSLAGFVRELTSAGARHVSVYDLTLEKGTPLDSAKAGLRFPDEELAWEARRRLELALGEKGMRRYEVSNYAAAGDECRHNLAYWRMDSYIGAGPAAVSTIARKSGASLRIEEGRIIGDYQRLSREAAVETDIDRHDAIFETLMMAFRTSFGLDLVAFKNRFGIEAEALIGESLGSWGHRIVAGEPWPEMEESGGPALDGAGLDILNRFLGDCLDELGRRLPR